MTLEEAVYARLTADAAVAAIIGTRAYPILAPQNVALPYVVFQRSETENLAHLGGRGTHDRVQLAVIAYAADSIGARALADAAQTVLDEWHGHEVVAASRIIGREQSTVDETETTPRLHADTLILQILAVET